MSDLDTAALPRPFCSERFTCLREGIFDHSETGVWLNESREFTCREPDRLTKEFWDEFKWLTQYEGFTLAPGGATKITDLTRQVAALEMGTLCAIGTKACA